MSNDDDNHLQKWLEENKDSVLAQMSEKDPMERVMLSIQNAMDLEKSKYPDWDDNKDALKVKIDQGNGNLTINVQRIDKKTNKPK